MENEWTEERDRLKEENERLREALLYAVEQIKMWHNMGDQSARAEQIWLIYYDHSPEMQRIKAALEVTP
jgi:hypothetical protein